MSENPQFGATWVQPQFGATWFKPQALLASGIAIFALLATLLAPASPADVATLSPSMVETSMVDTLGNESTSGVVELNSVRDVALNGSVGSGYGIDVALIDTGVAPVSGLTGSKVLHGPDLSFEAASPEAAYIDTYGHGTHLAGIIAGDRPGAEGVAPSARIVSLKVAGNDGITTVPQVVAAVDWVVEHRNSDGLNIRVLNLSLGQQGIPSHVGDELSAAVERAWDAGIFVVVAAGNHGESYSRLDSPAIDPYVMAVGAADTTASSKRSRTTVPSWTAVGDGNRNPDVVSAGRSIASYRVPGLTVDVGTPDARYGVDLFRGSGSSQAAAAVSGTAAALLSVDPSLSNNDLKAQLIDSADALRRQPEVQAGDGLVDGRAAMYNSSTSTQNHVRATGGSSGLVAPTGATWSGGTWSGATWSGATWSGATWSGGTWSGATWSGATWSGATWSGATWSGATWSGNGWVTPTPTPSTFEPTPIEPAPIEPSPTYDEIKTVYSTTDYAILPVA